MMMEQDLHPDVWALFEAACNGTITDDQVERLETVLHKDEQVCNSYLLYMRMHAQLFRTVCLERCRDKVLRSIQEPNPSVSTAIADSDDESRDGACVAPMPVPGLLSSILHGTIGYFSQEIPFSMLIATVVTALGLLAGSFVYVTHHNQLATDTSRPSGGTSNRAIAQADIEFVGHVTGMVDVKWSDINTSTEQGNGVPLGRKYALASGLMEITYDTGARVILQGPVTYEVSSRDGGFVSVGKLTASLEKKGTGIRGKRPETVNHNSSLSTLHSPLFTIKTPTATVTDLGTEFGVEVSNEGHTTSHVFRGSVKVQAVNASGKPEGDAQVLHQNESACIERDNPSGGNRMTVFRKSTKRVDFVRQIPKRTIKMFDLVDVVAGGNGFSGRRNASIDPTTGRRSTAVDIKQIKIDSSVLFTAANEDRYAIGDGKYHRVEELPFVDGVFIPDGSAGSVQVDSAGHVFDVFPKTVNYAPYLIWAGGAIPPARANISTTMNGIDYASKGHGLLFMHANLGIAFDLNAIRKANPGWTIARFLAVVANLEMISKAGTNVSADYWVLVDGHVRSRCFQINAYSGCIPITVPIKPDERFLTLVSTDGGNSMNHDHITFGDPRLELIKAYDRQATQKSDAKGGP